MHYINEKEPWLNLTPPPPDITKDEGRHQDVRWGRLKVESGEFCPVVIFWHPPPPKPYFCTILG